MQWILTGGEFLGGSPLSHACNENLYEGTRDASNLYPRVGIIVTTPFDK